MQNADFDKFQLVVRVRYADAGAILDMEKQVRKPKFSFESSFSSYLAGQCLRDSAGVRSDIYVEVY